MIKVTYFLIIKNHFGFIKKMPEWSDIGQEQDSWKLEESYNGFCGK